MSHPQKLKQFFVRISPAQVYFLKFVLEGYDNLFLSSTLDRNAGIILIRSVQGEEKLLMEILRSLARRAGIECVEEVKKDVRQGAQTCRQL